LRLLDIETRESDLDGWRSMVNRLLTPREHIKIAAIGKYTGHEDAYKSINEALIHAGIATSSERVRPKSASAARFTDSRCPFFGSCTHMGWG
jgi:CTP synthase (UTP-ammonia lyase)